MKSSAINYIALGKRMKKCRLQNKLAYRELCHLSNVSEKTLRNIESGNSSVSVANLISISNALNVSIDYLLMDSLTNKSSAIKFMINRLFEDFDEKETAIMIETGHLLNKQLLKISSIHS